MTLPRIRDFLSNGGYATWAQTIVILSSVLVAYLALRDTDIIQAKQTTLELARKYYSEQPSPALALLRLENVQLDVIKKAKESIPGYDPNTDPSQDTLLKKAQPMLKSRLDDDPNLQKDYETMRDVYYSVATCVDTGACDEDFAGEIFGKTILRFYNATCPYMEEVSVELKHAHDNSSILKFLQRAAKIEEKNDYFCRDWK